MLRDPPGRLMHFVLASNCVAQGQTDQGETRPRGHISNSDNLKFQERNVVMLFN